MLNYHKLLQRGKQIYYCIKAQIEIKHNEEVAHTAKESFLTINYKFSLPERLVHF